MTNRQPTLAGKAYLKTLTTIEKIEHLSESQWLLVKSAMDYLDSNTFEKIGDFVVDWVVNRPNATQKEFTDMLSQVAQPKGGTENMTNVASPGMPPGKIAAVPGESGNYPSKGKTYPGNKLEDWGSLVQRTAGRGSYSGSTYTQSGIAGARSPDERLETAYGYDGRSDQVGPVGSRGGTDSIESFSDTHGYLDGTSYTAPKLGYSRFPRAKIPSDSTSKPASAKSLFQTDDALFKDSSQFKSTQNILEMTPGKPNSKQTQIGTSGLAMYKRRKHEEEGVAGDYEGDDLTWPNGTGPDKIGSPHDDSPNRTYDNPDISPVDDGTSTGDQGDYGADFPAVKFEEEEEGLIRIKDEAERLDDEARELESKGYRAAAIVRREKAAAMRRQLPPGYYIKTLRHNKGLYKSLRNQSE